MRNKKGDLVKNTLSIVIAVIGLGIFIFGVARLYEANKNNEREQAKNVLDGILGKIDALPEGSEATFPAQGFSKGKEWYLVGWSMDEIGSPDKCILNSCICICPRGDANRLIDSNRIAQSKSCQEGGICRPVSSPIVDVSSRAMLNYVGGGSLFPEGGLPIRYENFVLKASCIKVPKNLFEVKVSHDATTTTIFEDYGTFSDEDDDWVSKSIYAYCDRYSY